MLRRGHPRAYSHQSGQRNRRSESETIDVDAGQFVARSRGSSRRASVAEMVVNKVTAMRSRPEDVAFEVGPRALEVGVETALVATDADSVRTGRLLREVGRRVAPASSERPRDGSCERNEKDSSRH